VVAKLIIEGDFCAATKTISIAKRFSEGGHGEGDGDRTVAICLAHCALQDLHPLVGKRNRCSMRTCRAGNLEPQELVPLVFLTFAMYESLNKALRSIIAGLHSTSPTFDLEPSVSWCRWVDE